MSLTYLRNAWYCAAESGDVGRQPFARIFLNEPVVMYRREDSAPVALEDTCAHRLAPLSEGTLQGDNIQCPYHGLVFNCQGKAIWAQGRDAIQASMAVRAYPIVDKYGWLWIWMGDPALADESKIFDCSICVDPEYATVGGWMHSKNAALLAIDNIMDLSHTAFVHAGTIGAKDDLDPELSWARQGENGIKGTRKALRMSPTPAHIIRGCGEFMLTQTKTMSYTPPYNSNVDIFTKEADVEPGQERFKEEFLTFNMITPETEKTSFYFWAYARNFRIHDKEFDAVNKRIGEALLNEDRKICESVQRSMDLNPNRKEVDLAADAGGLQARRILKRLIAQEASSPSAATAAE